MQRNQVTKTNVTYFILLPINKEMQRAVLHVTNGCLANEPCQARTTKRRSNRPEPKVMPSKVSHVEFLPWELQVPMDLTFGILSMFSWGSEGSNDLEDGCSYKPSFQPCNSFCCRSWALSFPSAKSSNFHSFL